MGKIRPREPEEIEDEKYYRVDDDRHVSSEGKWDCSEEVEAHECCCIWGGWVRNYYNFHWECTAGGIGCAGGESRVTSVLGPYDSCEICLTDNPDCKESCITP